MHIADQTQGINIKIDVSFELERINSIINSVPKYLKPEQNIKRKPSMVDEILQLTEWIRLKRDIPEVLVIHKQIQKKIKEAKEKNYTRKKTANLYRFRTKYKLTDNQRTIIKDKEYKIKA